ncbi:DUF1028 domain-containing protein [Citreicella sp. C3M06]|uniref:DUF1028 domain-containing protein n=1 Tax=Roseobacteraceae TaxID=2854170 RepID=UPI001C098EB5|nr:MULTISPECIES: DUF1028 domain-containing protein [Roseobacteraceae]MBU2960772.1 DUF1028 domain-containing protein [Citreicella sp. C3M06]MDO6588074.1 DUF1028 domain-containing protein [Salipiger sp. 1_MG-2023]
MTYSLAGRCPDTGRIGFAVTTSSVAVGARCGAVLPGCVVFSQARTDPRLHRVGLRAFEQGSDAAGVLEAMRSAAHAPHWRQLGVLTMQGDGVHHTGDSCLDHTGGLVGTDCLAIGNFLGSAEVLPEMVRGFEAASGPLELRLLAGMLAGEAAGSERDPLQSASLVVMGADELKDTDLRVDDSKTPLQDMAALYAGWAPKAEAYRLRAIDPDSAPDSSVVEGNRPA